jgi:hypothetical protein
MIIIHGTQLFATNYFCLKLKEYYLKPSFALTFVSASKGIEVVYSLHHIAADVHRDPWPEHHPEPIVSWNNKEANHHQPYFDKTVGMGAEGSWRSP